ncbi:MAG TPA: hypothetical protein VGH28_15380 [Polyangiaceae bacterium]|jgi:hypothetical protein
MKRLVFIVFALACVDPLPTPSPSPTPSPNPTPSPHPSAANVDVRIEFQEGDDPGYGSKAVTAMLVVPALGLQKKLFTVPFPYTCGRGATDASADLVVECKGEEGTATATVRVEPATIVLIARDYGRIDLARTRDEIPLPRGATATVFAPATYPGVAR